MSEPGSSNPKDTETESAARSFTKILDDGLRESVAQDIYRKIIVVSSFLAIGMERSEAARLAVMEPEDLTLFAANHPEVERYLHFKELRFKANLLEAMFNSVKQGNTKDAFALLEQKFPEEFNRKATSPVPESDKDNMLHRAIDHAREAGDTQPLARPDDAGLIAVPA